LSLLHLAAGFFCAPVRALYVLGRLFNPAGSQSGKRSLDYQAHHVEESRLAMPFAQASSVESFLILFSSFQKDVTLPPSLKLLGTTNKLFSGYQHV